MALTRVGLTISLANNADETGILFTDATGNYNATTNPLGYGLPNGIAKNDVTRIVLVLRYQSAGTYITYTFTCSSQTITAATLAIENNTATSILAELASTNWYTLLSAGTFNLVGDYGVTVPAIEDGVYQAEYTISGTSTGGGALPSQTFSYTTSVQIMRDCDTSCAIDKMFLDTDDCGCDDDSVNTAMKARYWLLAARTAAQYGNINAALDALSKAQKIAEDNCSDC